MFKNSYNNNIYIYIRVHSRNHAGVEVAWRGHRALASTAALKAVTPEGRCRKPAHFHEARSPGMAAIDKKSLSALSMKMGRSKST